jgi:hypothetical protein
MPKNEERRSNIVSSSSSSPRFFSWKSRNSSTKRHQQQNQQQQQQQHYHQQQPHPPISMSSPSSPLMMEKEQISSCSSPQLVRLNTPKPIRMNEQQQIIPTMKNDIRKIEENGNHQSDMDEHIQIALYAQQLASISDKHKQNPTGIQPPIRFPSCPMNLQMNNQYHPRMITTTPSATMIPMSSIRSMHMDHQSAEKRLIITKLEAKNR